MTIVKKTPSEWTESTVDSIISRINSEVENTYLTSNIPNSHPTSENVPTSIVFQFDGNVTELLSDSGRGNGFTGFKALFDSKSVKFQATCKGSTSWGSSGIITLLQAQELVADGYAFSHHIHATGDGKENNTTAQAIADISAQKSVVDTFGLNVQVASWYTGYSNPAYRSAVRKFYRAAQTTETNVGPFFNRRPINQYMLVRLSMDSGNYNKWIANVNKAIAENALIIFYGHPYTDAWYTTKYDDDGVANAGGDYIWQKIGRFIDYIQSKATYGAVDGILIHTLDTALNYHGNLIDVGYAIPTQGVGFENSLHDNDAVRDYFRLGRKGEVSTRKLDQFIINYANGTTYIGFRAGRLNLSLSCVAVGENAGASSSGNYMTAIGSLAGRGSTGENITAIGRNAVESATCTNTTGVGYYAGKSNTKNNLTAIGSLAAEKNTGIDATMVGYRAGQSNNSDNVCFVGSESGRNNTAAGATGCGRNALITNSGINATGVGFNAGFSNTAEHLTAVGYQSGRQNSGIRSSFYGYNSGYLNSGSGVVAIGYNSGRSNTASNCVFVGQEAGYSNTEAGVFLVEHRTVVNANPLIKGYFATGAIILGAPATATGDTTMGANRISFWLDEASNKLMFKVKYSDGTTIKSGEVALI